MSASTTAQAASARLRQMARDFPEARDAALYEFASELVTEKCKPATPVEYGTLRDTETATLTGPGKAEISAGGASADYAVYVHEDMEAKHSVGGAKFIERPMHEAEPSFLPRVWASMQRRLGLV